MTGGTDRPATAAAAGAAAATIDYVTMSVGGQRFGIPVALVRDVLRAQPPTRVPLAPREIAGVLNLRGRIVTVFDVRRRLGLADRPPEEPGMSIVVDLHGELYSLVVDRVGEVLTLPRDRLDRNPATLDAVWRSIAKGVHRLERELLVVMDAENLLAVQARAAA